MNKTKIKSFKRYLKEEKEKYYTLDLYQDMTKEEVTYYSNQLFQLTLKMLKDTDVLVTVEPVIDSEEQ